jgi:4-hydroxybenzoate polyprenyltransferase
MTTLLGVLAWAVGWRLPGIAGVVAAVLVGQLSIGWSNDAVDADLDIRAGRLDKPAAAGLISTRALWRSAVVALAACATMSVVVAGLVGGLFHLGFVAAGWVYNLRLSRTAWSWVPYAVGFACLPPFLVVGLTGAPPPVWMVAVMVLIGVSAHLANALPDLERDGAAGVGGAAVRLGRRRSTALVWVLLGAATAVLAAQAASRSVALAAVVVVAFVVALGTGLLGRGGDVMFRAVVAAVAVDALVLVLTI